VSVINNSQPTTVSKRNVMEQGRTAPTRRIRALRDHEAESGRRPIRYGSNHRVPPHPTPAERCKACRTLHDSNTDIQACRHAYYADRDICTTKLHFFCQISEFILNITN